MNDNRRHDNDRSRESRARPIRNISACGNITRIEEAMSRMILYMAPTFPTGRETVGSISPHRNLTVPADFIHQ